MDALRFFLGKHPIASLIFVVAVVGGVVFAIGALDGARRLPPPEERNLPLEPWMTPRFVGMSWGLPREEIERIMDIPRDGRPARVGDVAAAMGISLEELQSRVETAAAEHRANRGGRNQRQPNDDEQPRD